MSRVVCKASNLFPPSPRGRKLKSPSAEVEKLDVAMTLVVQAPGTTRGCDKDLTAAQERKGIHLRLANMASPNIDGED